MEEGTPFWNPLWLLVYIIFLHEVAILMVVYQFLCFFSH